MQLTIDKEFQSLLLPLTPDEYQQLKQNIIEDGCREPLVIWNNIIVDGHNRYQICTHNDIPFTTVSKDFADREAVKDWIDSNQLGRRNLSPDQSSFIRGRVYRRQVKPIGNPDFGKKTQRYQNDTIANPPEKTSRKLAEKFGVSHQTIMRDGKFAEAVESLPEIQEQIQQGKPVVKKNVIAAAKAKKEGDDEMAKKILEHGTKVPVVISVPDEDDERINYIFEQTKLFDKWDRQILDIRQEVLFNIKHNPAMKDIYKPFFEQAINKLRDELKISRPEKVCAECKGKGGTCKVCHGTGYITHRKGN